MQSVVAAQAPTTLLNSPSGKNKLKVQVEYQLHHCGQESKVRWCPLVCTHQYYITIITFTARLVRSTE